MAPYSYDLVDNLGRRSPRTLTPGADELVLGQTMAKVFRLTSFEAPHQWTGVTTPRGARLFGPVAMTYAAEPDGPTGRDAPGRSARRPRRPAGHPRRGPAPLAWGDLVMMRKQLHVLRDLAEGSATRDSVPVMVPVMAASAAEKPGSAVRRSRWMPAIMQRTEPPASSMVGMSTATISQDSLDRPRPARAAGCAGRAPTSP